MRAVQLVSSRLPEEYVGKAIGMFGSRISPSEGWLTLLLLLTSLNVVAWSVVRADWVETPSLSMIISVSAMAGLICAKIKRYQILCNLLFTVAGMAFVYWQVAMLSGAGLFSVFNQRLITWWSVAIDGGISIDSVPLTLGLALLAWMIGYGSAWATFRTHNIWAAILPGIVSIITNLSYLPDRFMGYLLLYLAVTMLFVIRLHAVNQTREWSSRMVLYPQTHSTAVVFHGMWQVCLLIVITAVLPLSPLTTGPFEKAWTWVRSPLVDAQPHFTRLFAGVPAKKGTPFRTFGSHLPFIGAISLGDEPLFLIRSPIATNWRSQTYWNYTSQGWISDEVEPRVSSWISPDGSLPYGQGIQFDYQVMPLFDTTSLPTAGVPTGIPATVEKLVQSSKSYFLSVDDDVLSSSLLPQDIIPLKSLYSDLFGEWNLSGPQMGKLGDYRPDIGRFVSQIKEMTPSNLSVDRLTFQNSESGELGNVSLIEKADGEYSSVLQAVLTQSEIELVGVSLNRQSSKFGDITSLRSFTSLSKDQWYSLTSAPVDREDIAASAQGTEYPAWVTDRYLQLPESLPYRVRDLAMSVADGIELPLDRAKAIEAYLRTLPYDQKIEAPPFDADGVDYFLFTAGRGYSDYFGSAMAVMLRAIGIPSRMVAGYRSGDYDKRSGAYVVRERDSHGWAEAYFPGFGWIEFEPTPGVNYNRTKGITETNGIVLDSGSDTGPSLLDELESESMIRTGSPEFIQGFMVQDWVKWIVIIVAIVGLTILTIIGGMYVRFFKGVRNPDELFNRLCDLGRLIGFKYSVSMTPIEYTRLLGNRVPVLNDDFNYIGKVYSKDLFGQTGIAENQVELLFLAWGRIRWHLLKLVVLFWRRPNGEHWVIDTGRSITGT